METEWGLWANSYSSRTGNNKNLTGAQNRAATEQGVSKFAFNEEAFGATKRSVRTWKVSSVAS